MRAMLRVILLAALACAVPAMAQSVVKTVPGSANPWLAGMPAGTPANGGDLAPAQSPVLVDGAVNVALGGTVSFSASGAVTWDGVQGASTPDGDPALVIPHASGAENGIGGVTMPVSALVGVFLGATQPDLAGPAPGALDFSTPVSRAQATLSPQLRQPFFIGDGLTGTGSGTVQTVAIPAGATRLYLGTMDGFGWNNNTGQFQVTVAQQLPVAASTAGIPTLSQWALVLLAVALAGGAAVQLRRRAR